MTECPLDPLQVPDSIKALNVTKKVYAAEAVVILWTDFIHSTSITDTQQACSQGWAGMVVLGEEKGGEGRGYRVANLRFTRATLC